MIIIDKYRYGIGCVEVKFIGTEIGGVIINRDRRKREGFFKGVYVITYTVWYVRVVTFRTFVIKIICSFYFFVDGYFGYNYVVGWEERKSAVNGKVIYSKVVGRALEDWI